MHDSLESDPLEALRVWERLHVGPTRLERRRLRTRYTLKHGRRIAGIDLIYKYREAVFDPASPESHNLASMISAQVALNYGLFCREIVFEGSFDDRDQKYIRQFASHTAREIYAIKFLQPNPFLIGDAVDLPVVRKDDYLEASVRFIGTAEATQPRAWGPEPDSSRHAVLSSGGKDSLLSYGILKEIGRSPHSIFVNESGRHWFTALNAYRHLAETDPNTARVWTNSDRVFAWMLRQLPFIRPDFAEIRADEYPIRLWTVAVFLFGALPLLRKRGISRLVIGDEFDTTCRGRFRGIAHYNGLYDQSRYFDEAMSRYFRGKGWNVEQFSVLRPLSEMLIQKALVERYPDLQLHQMSCHATHVEDGRIKPCGRCEKCRRIVGMLSAFGADSTRCGYSAQQVEACLAAIGRIGVHQEPAAAEHLTHLLAAKGTWPGDKKLAHKPRPHPEIMSLRFDPERSPIDAVPLDLRKLVYQIFLEHAEGAVQRRGRQWVEYDLLSKDHSETSNELTSREQRSVTSEPDQMVAQSGEPEMPSRRETERPEFGIARHRNASTEASEAPFLLGALSWPEAEARFASVDIVLLPVGAIEQHGAHLPIDTDAFDADMLAREVAAACSEPKPIVLPLIPYGVSYHHDDFTGTISIGPDSLARMVHDIGMSVARNGARKLVIINGHGGNIPALHFAAQTINRDAHIFTCVDTGETSDPDVHSLAETPNDVHAGEIETSTSLYLRPDLVRMERAEAAVPAFSISYLNFSSKRSVGWYGRTQKISKTGVLGDPTRASAEKGERMWQLMVNNLVDLVEELKSMTLEEIHQRRY
jgi:creatinine amidohydrolase/Fe(II)-dependent formamide hydrolase-like protein